MVRPERQIRFCCPLCNCSKFVRVRVRRPNGDWYVTEFYECFGCSVMFTDPEKFSGNILAGDGVDRTPRGALHSQPPTGGR